MIQFLVHVERAKLDGFLSLICPVLRVEVRLHLFIFIYESAADVLEGKVRYVCNRRTVEAPIDFESEAALYLEVQTSLPEFVVQVPLVESEATLQIGSVEAVAVDHHRNGGNQSVVSGGGMVKVYQVLRKEVIVSVINEALSVGRFAIRTLLVFC